MPALPASPQGELRAPLLERLASSPEERLGALRPAFDHGALVASICQELLSLLNTRRSERATTTPSVVDYGILDWAHLQAQRSTDRNQLAREIRRAIVHFEPRLHLAEVELIAHPQHPQQLAVRLRGQLRNGQQHWPLVLVIEQAGDGLEVRHE
ncbi:type VI secretion system baseplate subunit TssE [Pseudomonas sp. TE3610]